MSLKKRRVTVFFFHPFPSRSTFNVFLKKEIEKCDGVTVRDIYELYPKFFIDVEREKKALLEADVVIFQHPLYWYSCPSLMKEWLDVVLERGWAHGEGGDKLSGKYWLQFITAGSESTSYDSSGRNRFTVKEFLRPFEQTARLCRMEPLDPLVLFSVQRVQPPERDSFLKRYCDYIQRLQTDEVVPGYTGEVKAL